MLQPILASKGAFSLKSQQVYMHIDIIYLSVVCQYHFEISGVSINTLNVPNILHFSDFSLNIKGIMGIWKLTKVCICLIELEYMYECVKHQTNQSLLSYLMWPSMSVTLRIIKFYISHLSHDIYHIHHFYQDL